MGFSPLVDAYRHGHLRIQNMLRDAGGQVLGMEEAVVVAEERHRDGSASFKSAKPRPVSAPRGRSTATKVLISSSRGGGARFALAEAAPQPGAPMFQPAPVFAQNTVPVFLAPAAAFQSNAAPRFGSSRLF